MHVLYIYTMYVHVHTLCTYVRTYVHTYYTTRAVLVVLYLRMRIRNNSPMAHATLYSSL